MAKQMPASKDGSEKVLQAFDRQLISQWVQEDTMIDDVIFFPNEVKVQLNRSSSNRIVNEFVGAMVRQFPIHYSMMGKQTIWFKAD